MRLWRNKIPVTEISHDYEDEGVVTSSMQEVKIRPMDVSKRL